MIYMQAGDSWIECGTSILDFCDGSFIENELIKIESKGDTVYCGAIFTVFTKYNIGTMYYSDDSYFDHIQLSESEISLVDTWIRSYSHSISINEYLENIFGVKNEDE